MLASILVLEFFFSIRTFSIKLKNNDPRQMQISVQFIFNFELIILFSVIIQCLENFFNSCFVT